MRRQNEEFQAQEELETGNLDRYHVSQLQFELFISQFRCNEECVKQPRTLLEFCLNVILSIPCLF